MEPDLFFRIVDEIGKYIYRINLYGFGEPFIYDKTLDMVRYAADHNISVAIASNFNIVNEEIMERIIQSGLEHLIVSIDGIDQTSYEKYKVGGDFNKVITNVRLFQNMKKKMRSKLPFVDWQFVIMKHNAQMRKQAKAMAQELGIGIRYTCIGIDIKDHHQQEEWLPENESLSQYDYETLTPKGAKDLQTCSWLYRTVFINWDGGVSPCCNYYTGEKKSDFGDVKYRSFREVWNNQSYTLARQFVSKQKTLNEEDKKSNICGRCEKFCIAKGQ
jgi:MoaA/NifB/PqqE/SkfB family radical SAM enzyme